MRNVIRINDGWLFTLDGKTETVNLPHTWNAFDGQDGTNGYLRTKATYSKELPKSDKKTFLECKGVNSKAEIRVNNELVAVHEGGYSAFRVDISDYIRHGCRVDITADNSPTSPFTRRWRTSPSTAAFTAMSILSRFRTADFP